MQMPQEKIAFDLLTKDTQGDLKPNYQTVEGLKRHPLWQQLTNKQKKFVLLYIEKDGDRVAAARGAFLPRNDKNAENLAQRLLKLFPVRKLLSVFYGYELSGSAISRGEFMLLLSDRVRDPENEGATWLRMAQLFMALKGWKLRTAPDKPSKAKPEPEPEEPEDEISDVDKLVRRMEAEEQNNE